MAHLGKDKVEYIYINGIKPKEDIKLGEGVTFIASSCKITLDEIIEVTQNNMNLGVACTFLPLVCSCIRIEEKDAKELAVKTWNSYWDAILIGALFDREVGFNFQSNVPPHNLSNSDYFYVTNHKFSGLNPQGIKTLTDSEHKWIKSYYQNAMALLDDDGFQNAVHCLFSYRWHSMPRAQLSLLWSGIEGIFKIDFELSFRLSLYISRFLVPRKGRQQTQVFSDVKKLYSVRSKAVHGGKLKNSEKSLMDTVIILRRIIKKCAEDGSIPDTSSLAP